MNGRFAVAVCISNRIAFVLLREDEMDGIDMLPDIVPHRTIFKDPSFQCMFQM